MRIGIDARFYGPVGKGLGRYTQKLIKNIEKIDRENQYVVFLRKENWNHYVPEARNFKKVLAPFQWYTVREQLGMSRVIRQEKVDLMHFPHFNIPVLYQGKFMVTIHDLILLRFPTKKATTLGPLKYAIKELGYQYVIRRAVRRAEKIIAVSEFTRQDIINYFKINPGKVVTIYEGVDLVKFDTSAEEEIRADILGAYGITKPYILYVGNVYPHKNIETLLEVMKQIVESSDVRLRSIKLVIVCKPDYFLERIRKQAAKFDILDRVIFAGYVPDKELRVIYKNSELYVFPSFYEGFGLPPLEAMAQNIPVISSNTSSMPEILKDAALYFDPRNTEEIIVSIQKVLSDQDLKQRLVMKGNELVKNYNWEDMARETIKVYNETN